MDFYNGLNDSYYNLASKLHYLTLNLFVNEVRVNISDIMITAGTGHLSRNIPVIDPVTAQCRERRLITTLLVDDS